MRKTAFDITALPHEIYGEVTGLPFEEDSMGESSAKILLFKNKVLKIEKTGRQSNNEHAVMEWLKGRLPVPEVTAFVRKDGFNYLLMTRVRGDALCSIGYTRDSGSAVRALAQGLKMLWSIDISACPFENNLDAKLKEAKFNIDNGLVDEEDFNEDTLSSGGFKDVDELYSFLLNNRPKEDLVFTHGDYCLPNIFVKDGKISGFIDLGKAGVADRWQDIALCVRSLKYNLCEIFGADESDFQENKKRLYSLLGVEENTEKLRYYTLLDELF